MAESAMKPTGLAARLNGWPEGRRTAVGLLCAVIAFLGFNAALFFTPSLPTLDVTEERLYTLAPATHEVLGRIDEPIEITVFFSPALAAASPAHATVFDRLRELLERFRQAADGRLIIEVVSPDPYSDAEDRAIGRGLRPVSLGISGETGFLGLIAENSIAETRVLPSIDPARNTSLEYQLTTLLRPLADPSRPTIGILTDLPIDGDFRDGNRTSPWRIYERLTDVYEPRRLDEVEFGRDGGVAPDLDALMVIEPVRLRLKAAYAVDQFALSGRPVLVFRDPRSESWRSIYARRGQPAPETGLSVLTDAWGVSLADGLIAGDLGAARRVSVESTVTGDSGAEATDHPAWLSLRSGSFDPDSELLRHLDRLTFASAGFFTIGQDVAERTDTLVATTDQSMAIPLDLMDSDPDPRTLLANFTPDMARLPLIVRRTGRLDSAFPGPLDPAAGRPHRTDSDAANILLVADSDFLFDPFWAELRAVQDRTQAVDIADNGAFVLAAFDHMLGRDALVGLRERGRSDRPLTLIEAMTRRAEQAYRSREAALIGEISEAEARIADILNREQAGANPLFLAEERERILENRARLLAIRRELRDIRHAHRNAMSTLRWQVVLAGTFLGPALLLIALALIGGIGRSRSGKAAS